MAVPTLEADGKNRFDPFGAFKDIAKGCRRLRASARSHSRKMDSYGPVKRARVCEIAHTRCGTWRIFVFELHGVSRRSLTLRLTDSTLWG